MEASLLMEQAISALLAGNNVSEANSFLLSFADNDQAWMASILCIQRNTDDAVRYFAANILYTKVRKHWSLLGETERNQVYTFLSETVVSVGSDASNAHMNPNRKVTKQLVMVFTCCSYKQDLTTVFSSTLPTEFLKPYHFGFLLRMFPCARRHQVLCRKCLITH